MTPASTLPAAYYRQTETHAYQSSEATESPWDTRSQHGGPPAALMIAAVEEHLSDDLKITHTSVDFLGAIPQGTLDVTVRVLRPGRRIHLVEASLQSAGHPVAIARCWCLRALPADGRTRVG